MKILPLSIIFFSIIFYFFPGYIFSSEIIYQEKDIREIKDSLEEITVNGTLNIKTGDGTKYYLRGVFSREGKKDYCGYTWNNEDWFKGPYASDEGWKNFLPVEISSGSAGFTLKARFDPDDNGCRENGEYNFRIQRFTQSGSSSFDDQEVNKVSVSLVFPTVTPPPTKIPTVTRPPTGTPRPKAETREKSNPTSTAVSVSDDSIPEKTELAEDAEDDVQDTEGFVIALESERPEDASSESFMDTASSSGDNKNSGGSRKADRNILLLASSLLISGGGLVSLRKKIGSGYNFLRRKNLKS